MLDMNHIEDARETGRARELYEGAHRAVLAWINETLPDDEARHGIARALRAGAGLVIELHQPSWTARVFLETNGERAQLLVISRDDSRIN